MSKQELFQRLMQDLWHGSPWQWKAEVKVRDPVTKETTYLVGDVDEFPLTNKQVLERFPYGRPRKDKFLSGEGTKDEGLAFYTTSAQKGPDQGLASDYRDSLKQLRTKVTLFDKNQNKVDPGDFELDVEFLKENKSLYGAKAALEKRIRNLENYIKNKEAGKNKGAFIINPDTLAGYKKELGEIDYLINNKYRIALDTPPGALYNVESKAPASQFLQWEERFNNQTPDVKDAISDIFKGLDQAESEVFPSKNYVDSYENYLNMNPRGNELYRLIEGFAGKPEPVMLDKGILGTIQDQTKHGKWGAPDSFNFQFFDPDWVKVLQRYAVPGAIGAAGVASMPEDSAAYVPPMPSSTGTTKELKGDKPVKKDEGSWLYELLQPMNEAINYALPSGTKDQLTAASAFLPSEGMKDAIESGRKVGNYTSKGEYKKAAKELPWMLLDTFLAGLPIK